MEKTKLTLPKKIPAVETPSDRIWVDITGKNCHLMLKSGMSLDGTVTKYLKGALLVEPTVAGGKVRARDREGALTYFPMAVVMADHVSFAGVID